MLKQLDLSQLSYADLMARMTGRPDLKLARTYIRASQANLKLQKSLAFPEVSFKGTYDRAGNFINNYFAVGISFSVPICHRQPLAARMLGRYDCIDIVLALDAVIKTG